jgi:hypothetical protein
MLNNILSMSSIKNEIENFTLSERLNQQEYSELFYDHLTGLLKFRMLSADENVNNVSSLKLNERTYFGMEQYIFENTEVVEKEKPIHDIDWDTIDDAKDILAKKIRTLLKNEGRSETLKPIIDFTIDTYENSLIYNNIHPNSFSNPWLPTNMIFFNKGYLLLVSDKKDLVNEYKKSIVDKQTSDSSDLFVVATSGKEKGFNGFAIDSRSKSQGAAFEFLKKEASGVSSAKDAKKIVQFFSRQKLKYSEEEVKNKVLLPLKRAGLIGSSTNGYFYIDKPSDLLHAYNHHKEKLLRIQKTMDMYKKRGVQMGLHLD